MTYSDRLHRALARLRRRALADRRLAAALRGLLAAAAWVAVAWNLGRLWAPLQGTRTLAAGAAVSCLAAALPLLRHRPALSSIARLVDARFAAGERLATALDLPRSGRLDAVFGPWLLAEAAGRAEAVPPGELFPLRRHRGPALAGLAVAVLAAVTVLVARPSVDLALQERDHAAVGAAARDLQRQAGAATRDAEAAPGDARREALAQALTEAAKDLRKTSDPQAALERLSELGDKLRSLDDTTLAPELQAAAAAGGALGDAPQLAPLARALTAGNFAAAASAARALAGSTGSLDAAARQALAGALSAAAATAALSAPDLAAPLSSAAAALRQGDATAAAKALQDAAQQLDTLRRRQEDEEMVTSARNAAGADQGSVAQQVDADRRAGGSTGESGAGAAVVGGAGAQQPNSQGAAVLGPAQGGPAQQGSDQSGSEPAGGSGGQGGGSGGGTAQAPALGPHDQVFVPGPPDLQLPDDTLPPLLSGGTTVPLSDARSVLAEFQQAVLDALDRGEVDAGDRDLVRQYFSALGGS